MENEFHNRPYPRPSRGGFWSSFVITSAGLGALGVALLGFYVFAKPVIGPAQPIPFSHRFHVTERQLNCILCHPGVMKSAQAQIPPLETCMLCHERIIIHHPYIEKLRSIYYSGGTISWVRVNQVPDFVFFNHSVHFRSGFDCGKCHGNVAQMDRVIQSVQLQMGFCVQCHRDNNFSVDCYICHR